MSTKGYAITQTLMCMCAYCTFSCGIENNDEQIRSLLHPNFRFVVCEVGLVAEKMPRQA